MIHSRSQVEEVKIEMVLNNTSNVSFYSQTVLTLLWKSQIVSAVALIWKSFLPPRCGCCSCSGGEEEEGCRGRWWWWWWWIITFSHCNPPPPPPSPPPPPPPSGPPPRPAHHSLTPLKAGPGSVHCNTAACDQWCHRLPETQQINTHWSTGSVRIGPLGGVTDTSTVWNK